MVGPNQGMSLGAPLFEPGPPQMVPPVAPQNPPPVTLVANQMNSGSVIELLQKQKQDMANKQASKKKGQQGANTKDNDERKKKQERIEKLKAEIAMKRA